MRRNLTASRGILWVALFLSLFARMLHGQPAGTWSLTHPWIDGGYLNNVFFVDQQTGWISETDFLLRLLHTTDGGATWNALPMPVKYFSAQDLWFIDTNNGWMVGSEGRIFRTRNGGTSWETANNGAAGVSLRHVQFTTADSGWAAGQVYGTTTTGCILNTSNGGQNWQVLNLPDSYEIRGLFFLNSRAGFAIGYKLDGSQTLFYKTVDGGASWQMQTTLSGDADGLFFLDSQNGWITQNDKILRTRDGGSTWQEKQDNNWDGLTTIFFTDITHGYAAGSSSSRGNILRTSDGGNTWKLEQVPQAINSITAAGSSDLWAVGSGGTILYSQNLGASWSNLSYFTRNNFWSLTTCSASRSWIGSAWTAYQDAAIYSSADGGRRWNFSVSTGSYRVNDLQFVDSQYGWAALSSGIQKTVDGGSSWTRTVPAGWTAALHGLFFLNRRTGWAAGGGSVSRIICKTTDGGVTWTQQSIPDGNALMDVCFASPDSGWAAGMNSALLRTLNGGATWSSANSGIDGDIWLNSLHFLDHLTGFAGGDGAIFKTTDGGTTWQRKHSLNGIVEDIAFVDARHGWAAGSRAPAAKGISGSGGIDLYSGGVAMWQTADGGETWAEVAMPAGSWLLGIAFADLNHGIAAGRNGTILTYTGSQPIPAVPASLYARAMNNKTISITWADQATDEEGFYLYRREEPDGMWRRYATLAANTTAFEDAAVTPGIEYRYRLCAFNSAGRSALTTDFAAALVAPPPTPVALQPADQAAGQPVSLTLIWSGSAALSYHLQVATDPGFMHLVVNDSTISTTRQSIGPLPHHTTCFWRVRAKNSGGVSPWSAPRHFSTLLAAPLLLAPADGAAGQPVMCSLAWRSVPGAQAYHLQVARAAGFAAGDLVFNDSTLTDTTRLAGPLTASTIYYWRLKARESGGSSAWSVPVRSFATRLAVPVPAAPADGAIAQSLTPVLSWQPTPLATFYQVQVALENSFANLILNDSTITAGSRQIGPLSSLTTYFWRIRARSSQDAGPWSAPAWSFTTALAPPPVPVLEAPADHTIDVVLPLTLTWLTAERAAFYHLQVSTTSDFSQLVIEKNDLTTPAFQITGLAGESDYYWRVQAGNAGGNSGWSGVRHFHTASLPPTPPRLAAPANGSSNLSLAPTLTWNAVAGARSYHLQLSTAADLSNPLLDVTDIAEPRYLVNNLKPMTAYFWRVRAINSAGASEFSEVWQFFTSGASWTLQQSGVNQELRDVFFLDEQNGWIGGLKSTFLKTSDGGQSWQKLALPTSIYICSIHFFDLQTGLCCGLGGRILRTTDGGMSWSVINSGTSSWLESMTFIDDRNGWIAGDGGTILRTTDGGVSWKSQNSGTANRLEDIDFVDLQNGWAVGNNNTILHTSNGGDSWEPLPANIGPSWGFTIDFWDLQHGWCSGIGSGIYRTIDGGTQWTLPWQNYNPLEDLQYTGANTGYAVGWDGTMLKTVDGGESWISLEMGTRRSLKALFFLNPAAGWVVGDSGLVLATRSGGGTVRVEEPPDAAAGQLPQTLALLQNYPNPFNAATTFAFDLPGRAFITLTLHNLRGEQVAEIASGYYGPGRHELRWSARDLASGGYFVVLRTEDRVETRKVLYLR